MGAMDVIDASTAGTDEGNELVNMFAEATPEDHIDATNGQVARLLVGWKQRNAFRKDVEAKITVLHGELTTARSAGEANEIKFRINKLLGERQAHIDEIEDLERRLQGYEERLVSLREINEAGDVIDANELDL